MQVVIEVEGDERSEKKQPLVDIEGAALCQNAVKRAPAWCKNFIYFNIKEDPEDIEF